MDFLFQLQELDDTQITYDIPKISKEVKRYL